MLLLELLLRPPRLASTSRLHHRPSRLPVVGRHPPVRRRSVEQLVQRRRLRRSAVPDPRPASSPHHPGRLGTVSTHTRTLASRSREKLPHLEVHWWPGLPVHPRTLWIADAVIVDSGRSTPSRMVATRSSSGSSIHALSRRCLSAVGHSNPVRDNLIIQWQKLSDHHVKLSGI